MAEIGDATTWPQSQGLSMRALSWAARLWFAVVVVGQLAFAAYIVLFYTLSAMHGELADRAKFSNHGYIAGDTVGNLAAALHIFFAFLISLSAAMQLVPELRQRTPSIHRWNGRFLILGAVVVSVAGLYIIWIRGAVGDLSQHLGSTLEAALIFLFAALALRTALGLNFVAHRRWALRLFMVLSGVWFFRLGTFLWLAVNRGPAGFDQDTFTGPFLTIWAFGSYLLPLGALELYFLAQRSGVGHTARVVIAGFVLIATFGMLGGLLAVVTGAWLPAIQQAQFRN
jgi:hypothetical protein